MNLEHGEEAFRRDAQRRCHAGAVFRNVFRIVVGADAAVQPGVDPFGNAALAADEGMVQAGHAREQGRLYRHHSSVSVLGSGVLAAKPASVVRLGSETPSTLNICPMPLRPPPT